MVFRFSRKTYRNFATNGKIVECQLRWSIPICKNYRGHLALILQTMQGSKQSLETRGCWSFQIQI